MKPHYKIEWELWLAVHSLASMTENIRVRLAGAYHHLSVVDTERLPTEKMQNKLRELREKLKTNKKWQLKTCQTFAEDICWLYYEYANFEFHLHTGENRHV